MRYWTALLAFTVLLGSSTVRDASAEPLVASAAYTARVVELTNAERAKVGAPPLKLNAKLTRAAGNYAEVLASGSCFGHNCGPEPSMVRRIESAGFTNWSNVGENIAGGQRTPEEVVAGWMDSSGHRANILNPKFEQIGVGVAGGSARYGTYWAQTFGTRSK